MTPPSFALENKTAIITGASSGIGEAIAVAMAGAGAKTVLVGRDPERLERARGEVERVGSTPTIVAVDITHHDAPQRIVEEALAATDSIDVVVHSAGIFEPVPFLEASLESFDRQWATNVRAPYALTKAAVPHMKRDDSILFISSIAGHVGFPNSGAYCATKGAVELMVRALAMELAPIGIRVNALAPGNIRTPMNERLLASPSYEAAMIERTPYGRIGVVDDVSPVAVFLASDAARYVHGVSVLVDGGWVAQ
jgi:NAD(P)-dependent dehydrogenase (short-subunit alcohol dehydrogenase family)